MQPYKLYNDLINNPFAPKRYKDLAKFYEDIGRHNDAEAFLFAIVTKFNYADNPSTDQEQSINNTEMS